MTAVCIVILAMVTDVRVEQLTSTSVRVSWHQIIADEITNYMQSTTGRLMTWIRMNSQ